MNQLLGKSNFRNYYKKGLLLWPLLVVAFVVYQIVARAFIPATDLKLADLIGTFEVVHGDDITTRKSLDRYFIKSDTNKYYRLTFRGKVPDRIKAIKPGSKVKFVKPLIIGDQVMLGFNSLKIPGLSATANLNPNSEPLVLSAPAAQSPSGAKKVAIIRFGFSNNPDPGLSADTLKNAVFANSTGSASHYFREASFGQTFFEGKESPEGDVFGPYVIDNTDSDCNQLYQWTEAAKVKATADGHNMSGYDHYILSSHYIPSCGSSGFGQISGPNSWLLGASATQAAPIVIHELGHNLGSAHANFYNCNVLGRQVPVSISANCVSREYGDPYDVMGYNIYYGQLGHFNNYHKAQFGYIPADRTQTTTTSGTFIISAVETAVGTQLLRIPAYSKGHLGTQYYYIEYRRPIGYDSFMTTTETNGVYVRLAHDYTTYLPSDLIDNEVGDNNNDSRPSILTTGATFEDAAIDFKLKVLSVNSTEAQVQIEYPGYFYDSATCDTSAVPSHVEPNQVYIAPMTVTNNGTTTWDNSTHSTYAYYYPENDDHEPLGGFNIPDGVTIAPGQSHTFNLSFRAPRHNYSQSQIFAEIRRGNKSFGDPCWAPIVVGSDTQPPSTPSDFLTSANGQGISMGWTPSTDNDGVTAYMVSRRLPEGSWEYRDYLWNPSGGALDRYTDEYVTAGQSYEYTVQAVDYWGNFSSTSVIGQAIAGGSPTRPSSLQSSQTDSTVKLSWKSAPLPKFRVFRQISDEAVQQVAEQAGLAYEEDVVAGRRTRYHVVGVSTDNKASEPSETVEVIFNDSTPPSAPANFRVSRVGDSNNLDLSWTASTDNLGVDHYEVYEYIDNAGVASKASQISATTLRLTRELGHSYRYYVLAVDATGNNSIHSNEASVELLDVTAPTIPTNLRQTAQTNYDIALAWDAATDNVGVTGYKVFRDNIQVGTATAATYTDKNVAIGNHTYKLKAHDAVGNESAFTGNLSVAVRDVTAPTAPGNLKIAHPILTPTDTIMSWNASSDNVGVTLYNIFKNGQLWNTTAGTTYTFPRSLPTEYNTYYVVAVDAAGNVSKKSNSVSEGDYLKYFMFRYFNLSL